MILMSNVSVSVVYDSFVSLGGREGYLWVGNIQGELIKEEGKWYWLASLRLMDGRREIDG